MQYLAPHDKFLEGL